MEELIKKAKLAVIKKYEGRNTTDRKWVESSGADSYGDPNYRIKLFVLEGSPAKGFVVANYGREQTIAFDCGNKKIKVFSKFDEINAEDRKNRRLVR